MHERRVDFYYGIGSRYSYLVSTQLAALEAETGARVAWRPLASRALAARRGRDPFAGEPVSGQYDWGYRRRDAERWASLYGVPFRDPVGRLEWDPAAGTLACTAASLMGAAEAYAHALFRRIFVDDLRRLDTDDLVDAAREAGLEGGELRRRLDDPATAAAHEATLDEALALGAFGVPTFHLDGELFWGNDRLVLLRHALRPR
jgi:2-hydroxychromene-2-carboxylate isomerase